MISFSLLVYVEFFFLAAITYKFVCTLQLTVLPVKLDATRYFYKK